MKKALKRIYMILGAWALVLLCPVVCCESQVLRNHQNVDIPKLSTFAMYKYAENGNLAASYDLTATNEKDVFMVSLANATIMTWLKNGDELYDVDGTYVGYIKVLKDGNIELKNCHFSEMNGVYHATGEKARVK